MSPGHTMMRVYETLRARVMAGEFAPGERIDPARLAPSLAASMTPIRDALHRLAGERLVDNWKQEGFHQPIVTEAMLRDLYSLSGELLRLMLREGARARKEVVLLQAIPDTEWPHRAMVIVRSLLSCTSNLELRAAFQSVSDRLQMVRHAEATILPEPGRELTAVLDAVVRNQWRAAQDHAAIHHRRRIRQVPQIASVLRPFARPETI
jgi:hypothetical protein